MVPDILERDRFDGYFFFVIGRMTVVTFYHKRGTSVKKNGCLF
jgi:hypothetical protein